jgi:hypothetical protein
LKAIRNSSNMKTCLTRSCTITCVQQAEHNLPLGSVFALFEIVLIAIYLRIVNAEIKWHYMRWKYMKNGEQIRICRS